MCRKIFFVKGYLDINKNAIIRCRTLVVIIIVSIADVSRIKYKRLKRVYMMKYENNGII